MNTWKSSAGVNTGKAGYAKAFTLAELLTAVLVISIIMVALAPVITKRMKDNVSVTTDNKKGLEIYANPGTYTFDVPIGINTLFIQGAGGGGGGAGSTVSDPKTVTFTSSTTWTVPTGVNQITFEITGAGGGGGAGNGAANSGTAPSGLSYTSCLSNEMTQLRGAEDENDLCWTPYVTYDHIRPFTHGGWHRDRQFVAYTTAYTDPASCWHYDPDKEKFKKCNQSADYCGYADMCTASGANYVCGQYNYNNMTNNGGMTSDQLRPYYNVYRLPTNAELKKFENNQDNAKYWILRATNKLNIPMAMTRDGLSPDDSYELRYGYPDCVGAQASHCTTYAIWGQGNIMLRGMNNRYYVQSQNSNDAAGVHCVRALKKYNNYSGAGGASGAILEKTINVLPDDKLEITIGQGGAGGKYGTSINNGRGSRSGNGARGSDTKIVHKRNNIELGTYYVKGGFGGWAALNNGQGGAISTDLSTPSGTCYSRNRKDTSDSFTGGNTSCTTISYSGESGSSTKGGNGGRVKNTGSINNGEASSGGYLYVDSSRTANQRATNEEIRLAKGQNASTPGFGGGGGLTPAWANSTSHFYQGGKGANGKVEITYKVALPGGGGGSSARVAGVDNNNKAYEIIYKVSEGDRIVFKVGSGGSGGIENQDGLNGSATVVGDNDIVFLAGEGGKTATDTDKNNLKGGRGGYTSYINEEDNIQSNIQTGIKLKSKTPPITYTINPPNNSFKGQNGTRGGVPEADTIQSGYTITNTIFSYGFNGGMGASPFNVEKSKTAASISCGGGIQGTLGQTTNLKYLCTSGNTKGNDARNHDPVNNEFGGSGGGGGGVKDDSFEQGTGGNGSSGYLRIRWDASEQE